MKLQGIMILMPYLAQPPDMPKAVGQLLDVVGKKLNSEILHLLAVSPMTTTELADRIGLKRGSVHRVLRVLEDADLVTATDPPGVGRGGVRQVWQTNVHALRDQGEQWLAYVTGKKSPTTADDTNRSD